MDIAKYWTEQDCCDQAFNREEAGFRRAILLLLLSRFYLPFQEFHSSDRGSSPYFTNFFYFTYSPTKIFIFLNNFPLDRHVSSTWSSQFLPHISSPSSFFFGNHSLCILVISPCKLICFLFIFSTTVG